MHLQRTNEGLRIDRAHDDRQCEWREAGFEGRIHSGCGREARILEGVSRRVIQRVMKEVFDVGMVGDLDLAVGIGGKKGLVSIIICLFVFSKHMNGKSCPWLPWHASFSHKATLQVEARIL